MAQRVEKKARHNPDNETSPSISPSDRTLVTSSTAFALQRTIGNRATQRLLRAQSNPPPIQRGIISDFFSDVWDFLTGSSETESETETESKPKSKSKSSTATKPEPVSDSTIYTVTDPVAYVRTPPPALSSTGELIPHTTQVIIFERSRKSGKEYVNVARAMQPGDVGPPQPIGWTWRGNLSSGTHEPTEPEVVDPEEPEDIPTVDPVVPSPGDIPGLPTMPEITHAAFTDIVAELERMEQNPVKIEKRHKEEIGDAREERVKEIGSVRKKIAALTAETLGVSAEELGQAKAYLYRRLAPLAPYYNQIANTNMLEQYEIENGEPVPIPDKPGEYVMVPGWQRTCNVTVPAMVVEGLGKTKDDYKNKGNLPLLRSIFDHLEGKYKKRKFYDAVSDFDSLRLPDFMTLIAISYRMPKGSDTLSDEAFNEALKTARQQAANKTVKHNVITSLVKAFDAKTEQHKIYPKQLEKIGSARRNYIRKVLLGEKIPSKVKKKYESVKADELLPIETYREAVLAEVNPLLDSGAQILVGMENHFVRLDALDEDTVMVDDPGFADLKNVRVTWEQARDMGFFKVFWAVRG